MDLKSTLYDIPYIELLNYIFHCKKISIKTLKIITWYKDLNKNRVSYESYEVLVEFYVYHMIW